MLSRIALLVCCIVGFALAEPAFSRTEFYHGEQVWRCGRTTQANYEKILDEFDVWHVDEEDIQIRVKPNQGKKLLTLIGNCTVIIEDLEKTVAENFLIETAPVNATYPEGWTMGPDVDPVWHTSYHTLAEIVGFYQRLAANNARASFQTAVGRSTQGRNIDLFRIDGEGTITRSVMIQCGIHAREWISPAVCQYLADYFLCDRGWRNVQAAFRNTRLYIIPSINPDGYEWSRTNSRLWRKNRRPAPSGSTCIGVDMNRNYENMWGGGGSSGDPCSDTYRGPSRASEPETQVSQNLLDSLGVSGAVDMHSFSQLILRPYGSTTANSPDEAAHAALGTQMRTAIINAGYNTAFTSQKSIQLYATTGTYEGQAYGSNGPNTGTPKRCLGQTIELRPNSNQNPPGFQLPPNQIMPSGRELEEAFRIWLNYFQTRDLTNNCGR
jgi:murein tripeptide amidase MpaA